jgi:putative ABC transport system permease protein
MSPKRPQPPRLAQQLLSLLLPWQCRDEQLGDLKEAFLPRVGDEGAARKWYWRQVRRSIPSALALRYQTRNDDSTELGNSMETIVQDLKYGIRALWKNPGFAFVSTVTLALAIGVNTSIFSLVSVIIFADLPMQETETMHLIRGTNAELGVDQGSLSPADYMDLVERSESFESISALTESQWVMTGGDQPVRVEGIQFTAGLQEHWKSPPALGRGFAEGEDRYGAPHVAMLTYGFWKDQYSSDPDVLGQTVNLDGQAHTIIGVTNPKLEFASFAIAQVITPLILNRGEPNQAARYLFVSGRLRPGVTGAMATAEVARIGQDLAAEHPADNAGWSLWSAPVMESLIDEDGRTIMLLLQLTVAMVILIACANIANMLLARATARAREIAVRAALGAGRRRLIRQLLTESLMISFAAAGLGLAFGWGLNRAMIWISAGTQEIFLMAKFDAKVLAFTLLVSLVAPLAFGLFPALRASSVSASMALRDGRSADGGRSGKRARALLVTAQVSLALTLMIVATLLTRTVVYLQTRPLGFDSEGLLTVQLNIPDAIYEDAESRLQFFAQASEALSGIPGLGQIERTSVIPDAGRGARRSLTIEGRDVIEGRAAPTGNFVRVSIGYFSQIGLPIVRGRYFQEADDPESFQVAILSQAIADRYWPDEDPVSGRFQAAGNDEWLQVVGVVSDIRGGEREQGAMNIYVPHQQDAAAAMYLVSRTTADQALLAGQIREAIWSVDPNQPIDGIQTMAQEQYLNSASEYALLTLFITFAVFALFMASISIYGVMAYSVSQRRAEIGLRMAVGAEVSTIRWMILSQGARLLGAGIVVGLLAAFAVSRLLGSLVVGVSTSDPATFIGVPVLLASVAIVANLIPARRATRLDPAATLRAE